MDNTPDYRRGPDRRRQPRGGRRPEDRDGCAPLILLVGNDRGVVDKAEAILAKLKFAVSTSGSVDKALRVLPDLRRTSWSSHKRTRPGSAALRS